MSRITPRTWAVALIALTPALALAACGGGSTGTASSGAGDGASIGVVIKGLDNPFFQTMEQGIDDQAKAGGATVNVQAATSITDTSGQADKLSALAGQNFGCYVVNPITGSNLVQGLAQVSAGGAYIVNIDSPIDADAAKAANAKIATYIGTDNKEAGAMGAEQMATLLPNGGKIALVGGIAGDVTSGDRLGGFEGALPANITVAQTVAADWDRQTALTRATDILRANPDLAGFFVANDDMGLGVARAAANEGRDVKIISVDGNMDAFEAVKAGDIDAVVAQYPYVIGKMGVEACEAAIDGKDLPANVKAPVQVVTPDNVEQAISKAPEPGETYQDPFADLLGSN